MKVRIKFSKSGALVYIGHLDVMRYFQKLFRRADIPVAYTEGFSPHQILSFTPPLPLGMESDGEYADVQLTKSIKSSDAIAALSAQSVPEIVIQSFKALPEKCENAMAAVKAARYCVIFDDSVDIKQVDETVGSFLNKSVVEILKTTKKSERIINIRPLVYELFTDGGSNSLEMLISSGSTDNIKPELVLEALFADDKDKYCLNTVIRRIDQYTSSDDGLVSLDEIGTDII